MVLLTAWLLHYKNTSQVARMWCTQWLINKPTEFVHTPSCSKLVELPIIRAEEMRLQRGKLSFVRGRTSNRVNPAGRLDRLDFKDKLSGNQGRLLFLSSHSSYQRIGSVIPTVIFMTCPIYAWHLAGHWRWHGEQNRWMVTCGSRKLKSYGWNVSEGTWVLVAGFQSISAPKDVASRWSLAG